LVDIVQYDEHPELLDAYQAEFDGIWPAFLYHDPVSGAHHGRAVTLFSAFDLLLRDGEEVLASAWGMPMAWDGSTEDLPDGYDGALVRALEGYDAGIAPSTLCVGYVKVSKTHASRGLASRILTGMRDAATAAGLVHVVVPVRPTEKHRYPLQSMEEYVSWRREDGSSVDPWIRTHERMGARILGVARRSMVIPGTIAQWENWTDLSFPATGDYVVPEALSPVHFDLDADTGTYVEDNLWMQHS
jgi:hypothetical protein